MSSLNPKERKHIDLTVSHDGGPQPCDLCAKGHARVVYHAKKNRFFFGCSYSTEAEPCSGPVTWYAVQVPEELRVVPGTVGKVAKSKATKTKPKATKGRVALDADEDGDTSNSLPQKKSAKRTQDQDAVTFPPISKKLKSKSSTLVKVKIESKRGRNAPKRPDQ